MSEPFLGEIRMFGFGFAPQGWAQCNGQLLPISQNTALFSLLGTTYGGDGMKASGSAADSDQPGGRALGRTASHIYTTQPDASTVMNANMLGDTGGSQPHNNIQPYLAVNFCIALTGVFPARN